MIKAQLRDKPLGTVTASIAPFSLLCITSCSIHTSVLDTSRGFLREPMVLLLFQCGLMSETQNGILCITW